MVQIHRGGVVRVFLQEEAAIPVVVGVEGNVDGAFVALEWERRISTTVTFSLWEKDGSDSVAFSPFTER